MKKVYITGSSRGLGKALAEAYLDNGDHVVGLSRRCAIKHQNYNHITVDLSNPKACAGVTFDLKGEYEKLILVNNAGTLGEVKHVGSLDSELINSAIALNVSAPMILSNSFAVAACNESAEKYVLNIGSGAASYPIDGWSLYCASKAALHMFGEVFETENKIKNKNCKMRTLAPGIIDTQMQEEIRSVKVEHFSERKRFEDYKHNNELSSPREVAQKIMGNFEVIFKNDAAVQSIRNY